MLEKASVLSTPSRYGCSYSHPSARLAPTAAERRPRVAAAQPAPQEARGTSPPTTKTGCGALVPACQAGTLFWQASVTLQSAPNPHAELAGVSEIVAVRFSAESSGVRAPAVIGANSLGTHGPLTCAWEQPEEAGKAAHGQTRATTQHPQVDCESGSNVWDTDTGTDLAALRRSPHHMNNRWEKRPFSSISRRKPAVINRH